MTSKTKKSTGIKTIGLMTSGGDSPGMNCAIRSVVRSAIFTGLQVKGIYRGYEGLINNHIVPMELKSVGGIVNKGGTILLTARSEEFRTPEGRTKAAKVIKKQGIDALIVIGGDGSYRGAGCLMEEHGTPVVGIPGTIDNDIMGTDYTIGFDTAVNTGLDALDKIRDTATSHNRLFVVEVMGRHSGAIALEIGIGGGAESILVPEVKCEIQTICEKLEKGAQRGKLSHIIVVAEGAGSSLEIAYQINKILKVETRALVIGHLQRGGSPTSFDRMLASRMGYEAVNALLRGEKGTMTIIKGNQVKTCDMSISWEQKKTVDKDLYHLAEVLSI